MYTRRPRSCVPKQNASEPQRAHVGRAAEMGSSRREAGMSAWCGNSWAPSFRQKPAHGASPQGDTRAEERGTCNSAALFMFAADEAACTGKRSQARDSDGMAARTLSDLPLQGAQDRSVFSVLATACSACLPRALPHWATCESADQQDGKTATGSALVSRQRVLCSADARR